MGFLSEFKAFAMRGNVVDLAVGVIIGGAFGKIVSSMVGDIIMPIVGIFTGKEDFKDKFFVLNGDVYATLAKAKEAGAPVVAYGSFIQTVLDFTILAFVIFLMVRAMNKMQKKEAEAAPVPAAPEPTKEELLLTEIRDLLKR